MSAKRCLGFMMLMIYTLAEVSSRPSNNESGDLQPRADPAIKEVNPVLDKEEGTISYQANTETKSEHDGTKDIVDRIKEINNALNKQSRKQVSFNKPYSQKGTESDRDILAKIQQIIASSKLGPNSQSTNADNSQEEFDYRNAYSRAVKFTPQNIIMPTQMPFMSYPYVMKVPYIVPMPIGNNVFNGYENLKSFTPSGELQARQDQQQQPTFPGFPSFPAFPSFPSFPSFSFENFQFGQWPFASLFPVLIKNPVVALTQGGGFDNFIEYGQSADVCNRKQKSSNQDEATIAKNEKNQDNFREDIISKVETKTKTKSRKSRSLKKRTIPADAPAQTVEYSKASKKLYASKPTVTRKTPKRPVNIEPIEDSKYSEPEGDFRFPGGDFTWFWNKKPTVPSPGFFINRLRVRKGGVAIAGPGGVATAGRGGTAIVGPGGLAYTKPGGLAIAGPHARVVALSPYTDLASVLPDQHERDHYYLQRSYPIREGKLVATGPVIYYNPINESDPTS